jgi:ubiquinone/menaquinone biosynthesis C-methylase UbiE
VSRTYYRQVAEAFDEAAQNYDALYQGNRVMAWMRQESLAALQEAFPPGSHLLEIGCGTGDEALTLARLGYSIVATDISPAMIETCRHKAEAQGSQGIDWRVVPAGQAGTLLAGYEPAAFDGAYASFGALNCEPELEPVAATLARLLRSGARLVCSIMGRWCAWEIAWGLVHLRPRQAFRRLGQDWIGAGLASPGGTLSVPVRYYTPGAFARAFKPHFRVHLARALPVFLPPPYLDHLLERHPALLARLAGLERRWRDRFPFYLLGDHFLLVMERRGPEDGP